MNLIKRIAGAASPSKRGRKGIAALEFALTLPIWILLILGCTDAASMMLVAQRVDRITYTVTDIVTQSKTITTNDLDNIMLAAAELMNPYPFGSRGIVIVTSLYKPSGLPVTISWQYAGGGSLARESKIGVAGAAPSMPAGLTLNDNENVIVAEVYYDYRPLFINAGILSAGDIYRLAIYKPRLSPLITPPT